MLFSDDSKLGSNFNGNFLKSIKAKLNQKVISEQDIFFYMYAVFHSKIYRTRYVDFLRTDFPRLPLTSNVELFRQLCGLGQELVALHLLEEETLKVSTARRDAGFQVRFASNRVDLQGKPLGSVVEKGFPKYEDGKVFVNESQYFEGVTEDVWNFHIGGYQVCQKWLKDRRGRELSAEDIVHYGKVVTALGETIRLMGEVDGVIDVHGGWPVK